MRPRLLPANEVHKLISLGELFFKEGEFKGQWNPQHFVATWTQGIVAGIRFVLVLDGGNSISSSRLIAAFGAVVAKCDNTGDLIGCETFFYAHPEARGYAVSLLSEYEREAKRRGVKRIWMIHLENAIAERMSKWYERQGYALKERLFEKEI